MALSTTKSSEQLINNWALPPALSTPGRNPIRLPARSALRFIRLPLTFRRKSERIKDTNTRAFPIPRATGWKPTWQRSKAVLRRGFSRSGMAAINAITTMLKAGDHVVAGHNLYGGTPRLFNQVLANFGLTFTYVDTSDLNKVERAFQKNTRLLVFGDAHQSSDGTLRPSRHQRSEPRARC